MPAARRVVAARRAPLLRLKSPTRRGHALLLPQSTQRGSPPSPTQKVFGRFIVGVVDAAGFFDARVHPDRCLRTFLVFVSTAFAGGTSRRHVRSLRVVVRAAVKVIRHASARCGPRRLAVGSLRRDRQLTPPHPCHLHRRLRGRHRRNLEGLHLYHLLLMASFGGQGLAAASCGLLHHLTQTPPPPTRMRGLLFGRTRWTTSSQLASSRARLRRLLCLYRPVLRRSRQSCWSPYRRRGRPGSASRWTRQARTPRQWPSRPRRWHRWLTSWGSRPSWRRLRCPRGRQRQLEGKCSVPLGRLFPMPPALGSRFGTPRVR